MLIEYNNLNLNISYNPDDIEKGKTPLVFLHGFTGALNDWDSLKAKLADQYAPIAIDILGHGQSSSPDNPEYYTEDSLVEQLHYILTQIGVTKSSFVGYSMGGRLAFCYALAYPESIKSLILESSTAGIEEQLLRAERIFSDEKLADKLTESGTSKFIDYWFSIPLFDTFKNLPAEQLTLLINERKKNNPVGLANSLRGFGTGKMKNHWPELKSIKKPTLLITGELDLKFTEINRQMLKQLPNATHQIISKSGHNTHLEKPQDFFILVGSFLRTFIK
ncbi:MAG: 2-succinyl-6-hydroxy-2,4-cyclohexadiene-1-carboxylate synthase [Bacteroidetes bacterium]|nr:2-succinyl-6-hydroxy-2,4-cyclohexadiene-1-carboxylate synthase [Bacteroidota bacterium]